VGFLKNMKDAMGQAGQAQEAAQQAEQQAGISGTDMGQLAGARGALEGQGHEFNRILTVGQAGQALIKGHVDAGEQVAGNPVWIFDLEITPEGGAPYGVQHREIVSTAAMGAYPDGSTMACRIDPADPQKIAFGEKPFM
jgi:hypothetical protein